MKDLEFSIKKEDLKFSSGEESLISGQDLSQTEDPDARFGNGGNCSCNHCSA